MSRMVAVALLGVYGAYLYFQLGSHSEMFNEGAGGPPSPPPGRAQRTKAAPLSALPPRCLPATTPPAPTPPAPARAPPPLPTTAAPGGAIPEGNEARGEGEDDEEEDEGDPVLSLGAGAAWLLAITLLVAACSEALTGSIEEVSHEWGLSQGFLGFIVLPIAGNACEHVTAVFVAMKNKMDLWWETGGRVGGVGGIGGDGVGGEQDGPVVGTSREGGGMGGKRQGT